MSRRLAARFLGVAVMLLPLTLHAQINTDRMMTVGRNALYFDDYILSIQYFNQVINAKPYLYEPYFYRAIAKLSLEDWRGAEQDCNSSIERNPFVVNSYQVRGLALAYQQKYGQACADFRKGLSLDPEDRSLRHNLILCLAHDGHLDEALAQTDTLLRSWPKYAEGIAMRSDLLWEKGDSSASVECIDKAVSLDRFNPDLLVQRAVIKARMDMFDDALPDLDRAIYLDPFNTSAYMNRAAVHYQRDSLRAAMDDYDKVLQMEPSNVAGHYNRGNLRAQVGDDNRAIEDFDCVIEAEPDNMFAVFYRGVLRYQTGDWTGAETDISRVLDEYPEFYTGYQLRSEIREKLGKTKLAQEDAMIVFKEHNRRYNRAHGYADDEDDAPDSKTRSSKDKNLAGYRKIIVDEGLENSTGFSSEFRGRVQNRNVQVTYLAPLRLTYFSAGSLMLRRPYTSYLLDGLNAHVRKLPELRFEDSDIPLNESQISALFADIERLSAEIAGSRKNVSGLLLRAVDFCLLQDFQSALADMESAQEIDPDNWILWFIKAQVLSRMDEMEGKGNSVKVLPCMNRVIELEPDMAFALYNRGIFLAGNDELDAALVDFDRAIELVPEMAQAWYNRAVVLVLLDRTDEAVISFSKAGELGIVGAYNVIKRFSKTE